MAIPNQLARHEVRVNVYMSVNDPVVNPIKRIKGDISLSSVSRSTHRLGAASTHLFNLWGLPFLWALARARARGVAVPIAH